MAYNTSKAITLGQAMTIAERTKIASVAAAIENIETYGLSASAISYEDTTVQAALDDLLYEEIAISSFTNTVGTVEIGTTVDSCTFKWAINKTPTTLTLAGESLDITLTSYTKSDMGLSKTAVGSQSYTLVATDDRDASSSKSTSIYFYNGVYYGVGDTDSVDSDFILAMTKTLQNSKTKSFTVTAGSGQYIYYALPTRLGTPTFYVGGFEGGFSLDATIDFTNSSGFTESYNIYKSTNANLGSTTVSAS